MIRKPLLCLLICGYLPSANAEITQGFSIGEAFSIDSKELLYRETHCQSEDRLKREVLYKNPKGKSIAYKTIDYRNGFSTPSFKQTNFETLEETEVIVDNNIVTLSFTDSDREQTQKSFEKNRFSDLPVVIDAGFDAYIRDNWDSLISGEALQFQFPLATRAILIELQASASDCSYDAENNQCFKLEMSNWLYRVLASPIELGYDRKQKQLIRYRGLSNIEDENGKGLNVDIRYSYEDMPIRACQLERSANHG